MSIHVAPEPNWVTKEFRGITEVCVSCRLPTTYWHRPTNTPCCEWCASNLKDVDALMAAKARPTKTVAPR